MGDGGRRTLTLVDLGSGVPGASRRGRSAHGKEGVAFGLYTMTGRAVAPLAPFMFSTFVAVFGADRAGIGGLLLVLAAGFTAMLAVRAPRRAAAI